MTQETITITTLLNKPGNIQVVNSLKEGFVRIPPKIKRRLQPLAVTFFLFS